MTAGIPIVQSCEILMHSQKSQSLRLLIMTLKKNIETGNELSRCLAKFPRYFDTFVCHLIQTGEQTGTLPTMLDRIALQQEKALSTKNKIKQALFYPTIVLLVASIVCIILLTTVIPRFAELFQSMHSSLPAFTRFIIELSTWMHRYYWTALFPLSAITLLIYSAHHSMVFRCRIEKLLLQVPILGTLYGKIILSRFLPYLKHYIYSRHTYQRKP